jgi:hypothetical protein
MSNRLSFAHVAPRREPAEWLPAPSRKHGFAAALHWLNDLASTEAMSPAMARDLGLPVTEPGAMPFAYEIERSRVRV